MKKKERIEWIDYLKTFSCFLVVIGHLLQSLIKANIDTNPIITNYIIWFIYLFHMPVFMSISGLLYNQNCINSFKQYIEFVKKKFLNLIVPYVTFYLIYIMLNFIFSNSVNSAKGLEDLIGIINNPISPYWFLYALMSIFLFIPIIEKLFKNNKKNILLFMILLKIISLFYCPNIYLLSSIMKWGIYFYTGILINNKRKNIESKSIYNILQLIIYILTSVFIYKYNNYIPKIFLDIVYILFAISGIIICYNIFKKFKNIKFFDIIKKYTFEIYLTHTIFAAGMRILLLKFNVKNYFLHFVVGTISSIVFPITMSKISKKIGYTEFFFYPVKTIRKYKKEE